VNSIAQRCEMRSNNAVRFASLRRYSCNECFLGCNLAWETCFPRSLYVCVQSLFDTAFDSGTHCRCQSANAYDFVFTAFQGVKHWKPLSYCSHSILPWVILSHTLCKRALRWVFRAKFYPCHSERMQRCLCCLCDQFQSCASLVRS